MLISSGYTLCYAAKWLGSEEIFFDSIQHKSPRRMLRGVHKLLDEADAVVTYNGDHFDIPVLNRDFILNGYKPPSPAKSIDLYKTIKSKFKFPSNKLQYVAKALGVGEKTKHIGYDLWKGVMENSLECWEMMEEYNINDVIILEKVYEKLLPWIKGHSNHSIHNKEEAKCCPNCGSTKGQKRGYTYTVTSKYQRYQCVSCGHWYRDNVILNRNLFKTSSIL